MIFENQGSQKPNELIVNRYLYAAYLKGKKTTRKSTCCACCSWWCCKGGRGCAEVSCMQTDCTASCLQTCASCCPIRIPDITNFGVAQFSHKYPYVQRWYNVLQFTKGNMQWVWKPENNALQRRKNTKDIIINHKGTRMVKDEEDWHGLQIAELKSLAKLFKPI